MDDVDALLDRVHDLSDLELAVLLSLIADQHCLIESDDDIQDDVAAELGLIVSDVFKFSHIILERDDLQSVDKFGELILDEHTDFEDTINGGDSGFDSNSNLHTQIAAINFKGNGSSVASQQKLDTRKVVNVIIAKDFNLASEAIQIQMLELIRSKRVFSRTTVHAAPKEFLFLPLVATSTKDVKLTKHLNDRIFISHRHQLEDGFLHLEELDAHAEEQNFDHTLGRSPSARSQQMLSNRRIDSSMIEYLRDQGHQTTVTTEIRRYLQDIVVFLRMERSVDGGISPFATTQLLSLAKYLAPLHGIHYVTPSLVALAARKVYSHRIIMATPQRERSTQYGTSLVAAQEILEGLDPQKVIDNVLGSVRCPA
ncbi:hypothetical protein, variant [Exophiala mesophila]|uniref:magnesium chelatase n=1 Tax=Exophiala mesophila TaxID=212818 RepID=A0A0D1WVD6_EXOME|nr:uncharacterized protein PV10_04534 [Exophiala mesophila]XP_016224885.1 hypothetical protein, variant [Exophiala mesophila]KIV93310.1 hypothetical protein PV10_04534 [Exophiala mesophila]KIV93311.1 hypothetical protein, variant [Exophiala mesophila]